MLRSKQIKRLKRFMTQADEVQHGDVAVDAEIEAARHLRDLALRVKTREGWAEFFAIAEADGGFFPSAGGDGNMFWIAQTS
ncbi:hypothetical protein ACVWXL_005860 [Bradyrhizobium sp. GM22.5]